MTRTPALEPIGGRAALIVIDVQRLFAEATEWRVPGLGGIVPAIGRLIDHRPDDALFTRFITPQKIDHATGRWRHYYRRWASVTLEHMPAEMIDLIPELADGAPADRVFDKTTFSSLADGPLCPALEARSVDTLVLAGVETDVCVLATALDAIDRGYRVVLAADAITSSSPEAHRAALDIVYPRFDLQIDVATVEEIRAAWPGR